MSIASSTARLEQCLGEVADTVLSRFPFIIGGLSPLLETPFMRFHIEVSFMHDANQEFADIVLNATCWTVQSQIGRETAEFTIERGTGEEIIRIGPVDLPEVVESTEYSSALEHFVDLVCLECASKKALVLELLASSNPSPSAS
jgi:hypothetical protein